MWEVKFFDLVDFHCCEQKSFILTFYLVTFTIFLIIIEY